MPEIYKIHNTHRFSRFLEGGSITVRRGSPVPVSFEKLCALRDALLKEKNLEVRNSKGQLVDLVSGEGILRTEREPAADSEKSELEPEKMEAKAEEPQLPVVPESIVPPINSTPNFPLDSAANDKTFEFGVGEHFPNVPGGKAPNEEVAVPTTGVPGQEEDKPVETAGDPVAARKHSRSKKDRNEEG